MDHIGPEPTNWPLSIAAAVVGLLLLYWYGGPGGGGVAGPRGASRLMCGGPKGGA